MGEQRALVDRLLDFRARLSASPRLIACLLVDRARGEDRQEEDEEGEEPPGYALTVSLENEHLHPEP